MLIVQCYRNTSHNSRISFGGALAQFKSKRMQLPPLDFETRFISEAAHTETTPAPNCISRSTKGKISIVSMRLLIAISKQVDDVS
jgi:hypothetical protein